MTQYLTTLDLPMRWLDALRRAAPDVQIRQLPAARAGEIPEPVWAEVEVLHTHSAIPDPALAPRLRWVQLDTAGVDHLDGHPIWGSPVQVTTLGGVSTVPMAEYVAMMTLAHHHHLWALRAGQASHEWPPPAERFDRYLPRPTAGATMVIVGYGRIGRQIGRLARALGMQVVGVSRSGVGEAEPGVQLAAVDTLGAVVAGADVLVLVTPRTPQTLDLVSDAVLEALKPGALLIDIGRGGVLDHAALGRALDRGSVAAAVLDVAPTEPLRADDPLWDDPRVTMTPHVAGLAPAYYDAILELVADNLHRLDDRRPLRNLVNAADGY